MYSTEGLTMYSAAQLEGTKALVCDDCTAMLLLAMHCKLQKVEDYCIFLATRDAIYR